MTDTSFTNPANWLKGPGVPYDRYTLSDSAPDGDDDLYFTGDVATGDCTIPSQSTSTGQNAFAGIHLLFGTISEVTATVPPAPGVPPPPLSPPPPPMPIAYGGTVTLSNSFSVGTLEVECGNISQGSSTVTSGNGTTLTITSSLDWTGGTLNSNTVAGTIALAPGATGVAEPSETNPGINGTVKLGSTLLLGTAAAQIGCELTFLSGTYTLTSGAGIISENLAQFILKGTPYKVLTIDGTQASGPLISVKKGSTALVTSMRLPNDEQLATIQVKGHDDSGTAFANGGTTRITNRTELDLVPEAGESSFYFQEEEEEAVTELEARSQITLHKYGTVSIRKGTLAIRTLLSDGNNQADATIKTDQTPVNANEPDGLKSGLTLGKDATLTMPGGYFSKLKVIGDFLWNGTVNLALSRTSSGSDLITADNAVRPDMITSVLNLRWANPNIPFGRMLDDEWKLVEAQDAMARKPTTINEPADTAISTLVGLVNNDKILRAEVAQKFS